MRTAIKNGFVAPIEKTVLVRNISDENENPLHILCRGFCLSGSIFVFEVNKKRERSYLLFLRFVSEGATTMASMKALTMAGSKSSPDLLLSSTIASACVFCQ